MVIITYWFVAAAHPRHFVFCTVLFLWFLFALAQPILVTLAVQVVEGECFIAGTIDRFGNQHLFKTKLATYYVCLKLEDQSFSNKVAPKRDSGMGQSKYKMALHFSKSKQSKGVGLSNSADKTWHHNLLRPHDVTTDVTPI